jgi:hypothetical protein
MYKGYVSSSLYFFKREDESPDIFFAEREHVPLLKGAGG